MNRTIIPSEAARKRPRDAEPDDVQERLVQSAYVHHDHGGHEHGHDWDDWLKADRALKSKGNKRKRVHSKPEAAAEEA